MTTKFKVGDTVRYKARFLKSVGWHTDVPDGGTVVQVVSTEEPPYVKVDWHDGQPAMGVLNSNLIYTSSRCDQHRINRNNHHNQRATSSLV